METAEAVPTFSILLHGSHFFANATNRNRAPFGGWEPIEARMARPGWLLLNCAVQKYAWGKVGASSTVAQLSEGNPGFELDPEAPYAEVTPLCDCLLPSYVATYIGEWYASSYIID